PAAVSLGFEVVPRRKGGGDRTRVSVLPPLSFRSRLITGGSMALNPKGFWRVLIVLYAVFAVTTAVVTGIAVSNELECPNRRANRLAEHRNWQQLPRCQHPALLRTVLS